MSGYEEPKIPTECNLEIKYYSEFVVTKNLRREKASASFSLSCDVGSGNAFHLIIPLFFLHNIAKGHPTKAVLSSDGVPENSNLKANLFFLRGELGDSFSRNLCFWVKLTTYLQRNKNKKH